MNKWHPDDNENCIFGDIMNMCKNKADDKKLLNPKKVEWKKSSWCVKHHRECHINLPEKMTKKVWVCLGPHVYFFLGILFGKSSFPLLFWNSYS